MVCYNAAGAVVGLCRVARAAGRLAGNVCRSSSMAELPCLYKHVPVLQELGTSLEVTAGLVSSYRCTRMLA